MKAVLSVERAFEVDSELETRFESAFGGSFYKILYMGFLSFLDGEKFSAKACNKIGNRTYNGQKEKIRKGKVESTAQPNKILTKLKEIDKNGNT